MKKDFPSAYWPVIRQASLFRGMEESETGDMLRCLCATATDYAKNEFVLRCGDEISLVGMVLAGRVNIVKEDYWGNRHLVSAAAPGELFAEAYACTPGQRLGVSVVADGAATVMFLDVRRLMTTCSSACTFHARLIRNLLGVLAQKNLQLNEKLTHMAQRTTREKLLSYLSAEALRQGGSSVVLPFNRQQLADYLCVDRSAMCAALGKMRDDGLLSFDRRHVTLRAIPRP